MIRILLLWTTLTAVAVADPAAGRVPGREASRLRAAFTAALADPEGAAVAELLAIGDELAEKYAFDDLMTVVRDGPDVPSGKPRAREGDELEEFNNAIHGYSFSVGGETFFYAVDYPRGYGKRRVPLVVDAGVHKAKAVPRQQKNKLVQMNRNWVDRAGLKKALVIRTEIMESVWKDGRRGARADDEIAAIFDAFYRDVLLRLRVDPNRIYAAGQQQTGFWSLYLAQARPDRYAGTVGLAPPNAADLAPSASGHQSLPTWVGQGARDPKCKAEDTRRFVDGLKQYGAPHHYEELENAAHDEQVWNLMPTGLKWLVKQGPRDPYPKRVARALRTTAVPWCYWIRVDGLSGGGSGYVGASPTGTVRGSIDGQAVTLTSEGVAAVTVAFSPEMLDLDKPVSITWNGEVVHDGPVARDIRTALSIAVEKADWVGAFDGAVSLTAP